MPENWKIYHFFYHSFKNMNLEDHLYFRKFYLTLILKHFSSPLKSCPIFDELIFLVFTKYNGLFWVWWFFAISLVYQDPPLWNSTTQMTLTFIPLYKQSILTWPCLQSVQCIAMKGQTRPLHHFAISALESNFPC